MSSKGSAKGYHLAVEVHERGFFSVQNGIKKDKRLDLRAEHTKLFKNS